METTHKIVEAYARLKVLKDKIAGVFLMNRKLQIVLKVAICIVVLIVLVLLIRLRDWTAIAALAALAAAIAVGYQTHANRFAMGVDLALKLDERFERDEFREKRQKAARALRANDSKSDVEDILDFFETLGLLVRRKALDKEIAWNTFFYWSYGYCFYAKEYIEAQVKKYPTRYQDLLWLHTELVAMEKRKKGTLDEHEWRDFLDEEERTD